MSNLNRPGVLRLNIGLSWDRFRASVGVPPTEAEATFVDGDFAALDRLLPHPHYARQAWPCVRKPIAEILDAIKPLLAGAYAVDVARHTRGGAEHG